MPAQRFLGQHVEIDALDAAGRAGEAAVDHFVVQADRLEDLRALVALQRRDAHLGHHFEHALGDALAIGVHDLVVAVARAGSRPSRWACHSASNARYGIDRAPVIWRASAGEIGAMLPRNAPRSAPKAPGVERETATGSAMTAVQNEIRRSALMDEITPMRSRCRSASAPPGVSRPCRGALDERTVELEPLSQPGELTSVNAAFEGAWPWSYGPHLGGRPGRLRERLERGLRDDLVVATVLEEHRARAGRARSTRSGSTAPSSR